MKVFNMKPLRLITIFLLFSFVIPVYGQTASNNSTETNKLIISLSEAKNYAIAHNKNIENASLEIKKAERLRWQTLASMLPQANATANYQNTCGYEMQFGEMTIPMNPTGTLSVTASMALSATQVVGLLLQNIAMEMADINKEKNIQTITTNVEKTYLSALVMTKNIELLDKSLENMQKLYTITQNSVNVGVAEQTDADKISVQLSMLKDNASKTKRQLEMLYNSLLLQLGAEIETEIVLTEDLEQLINKDFTNKLILHQFRIEDNIDYKLLQKNTELTKKQALMSTMAYTPTLSTFYQYSKKTYFGESEFMNMTPPSLVGININIPLWSSGVNATKVQEKKIAHQINENNLIETKRSLLIQNKQLKNNLITALENYNTQLENIEVSERLFTSISNKYEYGHASSLDVTNASNQLVTAQTNYMQAVLSLITAQIELKQLLNIK